MVTFFRGVNHPGPNASMLKRHDMIVAAYKAAEGKFKNYVTGGSHPLTLNGTLELISAMNVEPLDQIWEIGCGVPVLAASLSAASGSTVLCTDVENTQQQIELIMETTMENRDISKSNALLDMIYREKLDDIGLFIRKYKPFGKDQLTLTQLYTELNLVIEEMETDPSTIPRAATNRTRQKVNPKTTSGTDRSAGENDQEKADDDDESEADDESASEADDALAADADDALAADGAFYDVSSNHESDDESDTASKINSPHIKNNLMEAACAEANKENRSCNIQSSSQAQAGSKRPLGMTLNNHTKTARRL